MDKNFKVAIINTLKTQKLLLNVTKITITPVFGGDINTSYKIQSDCGSSFFLKTNRADKLLMFKAESQGLSEITQTNSIKTPKVIDSGVLQNSSYLLLEYLPMSKTDDTLLAKNLAKMHQTHQSKFGWHINNTIGLTAQKNTLSDNWVDFWTTNRLLPQLLLAKQNGAGINLLKKGEKLIQKLDELIPKKPKSSLLHGDLWSGNWSNIKDEPIIFDPAVYYGDRETDLAMSRLFGGFSTRFYEIYQHHYPLDSGFENRQNLYNLYHILNHFNLFGGGYEKQALNIIEAYL